MFSYFKLLASFWSNFYLSNYESKYRTNLTRTNRLRNPSFHNVFRFIDDRRFHNTFRFTDKLCALNDGSEFGKDFLETYPAELESKVKYNGSHATLLDLDFAIDKGKFTYKICSKRVVFNFHIVRIPLITINIPSIIFYFSFTVS